MKKFVVIGFLLFFSSMLHSQKLMTYKGMYIENEKDRIQSSYSEMRIGEGIYEYYENDGGERILHGKFNLTEKTSKLVIKGQYLNNKKHGVWKITTKDYGAYRGDYSNVIQETTAEYLNGKLNGKCSIIGINKNKKVVLKSNATFKNNVSVGPYSYSQENNEESNINIKINYDNNGLYDGDYLVSYMFHKIKYEDKRKYKNGELQSKLFRNMTDGTIIYKYNINSPTNVIDNTSSYTGTGVIGQESTGLNYWKIHFYKLEGNTQVNMGLSPIYIVQRGIDIEGFDIEIEKPLENNQQSDENDKSNE